MSPLSLSFTPSPSVVFGSAAAPPPAATPLPPPPKLKPWEVIEPMPNVGMLVLVNAAAGTGVVANAVADVGAGDTEGGAEEAEPGLGDSQDGHLRRAASILVDKQPSHFHDPGFCRRACRSPQPPPPLPVDGLVSAGGAGAGTGIPCRGCGGGMAARSASFFILAGAGTEVAGGRRSDGCCFCCCCCCCCCCSCWSARRGRNRRLTGGVKMNSSWC